MKPSIDTIPVCETIDAFGWDNDEDIRDLIRTTPLLYDADGVPVGYDAGQLFGLEADYLVGLLEVALLNLRKDHAMTDTIIELCENEFNAQFPLRSNHLNPTAVWAYGQGGGCLFETFGEELAFVRRQDPRTVWTLTDDDDGDQYVLSGFHLANRLGYLISSVPFPEETIIQVHIPIQPEQDAEAGKHTAEPWGDNDDGVILGNLDAYTEVAPVVAVVEGYDENLNASNEAKANARRICATVNACKGISTEALERGIVAELFGALRDCVFALDENSDGHGSSRRKAIEQARALLAEAPAH